MRWKEEEPGGEEMGVQSAKTAEEMPFFGGSSDTTELSA